VHVPLVLASGRRWLELEACAGASDCPTTDTRVRDPGRTVATPVGTIDLAATLSGLAGTTMPTAQDSTDLAPCLAGECGFDRALWTETYIEEDGALTEGAGAVRVGSDKLVALWEADGACEKDLLFDLQADPLETTDLADTDLDTRAALRDALATIGPTWLDGVPPCEEAAVTASGSPRSR
jgi:arylsulfatase A-like enzyme